MNNDKVIVNSEQANLQKRHLIWACRRGMLELDIILNRYLENHYEQASLEEQGAFRKLLTYQDPELFKWLVKREAYEGSEDEVLFKLIQKLL